MLVDAKLFPEFAVERIHTPEAQIHAVVGGSGPPLLLLHGHPQTHAMWHRVASHLARACTVVAMDLRGYGRSSVPSSREDHEPYSKRAMARDAVAVMRALGFEHFAVAGHDRGARCAYRLALDHPDRVTRLSVLDIVPTADLLRSLTPELFVEFWHWAFLAQPHDLPERLISADAGRFYFRGDRGVFDPLAFADYERAFLDPARVHAMCEDYRAGLTLDAQADDADRGRTIDIPVLALWSTRSVMADQLDVLALWRRWAPAVRGWGVDAGHYLPEEAPAVVRDAYLAFFSGTEPGTPD